MAHRSRLSRAVAALGLAAIVLSGCSEDQPAPQAVSAPARPAAQSSAPARPPADEGRLAPVTTVRGDLRPKSVVATGTGLFVAQNMMYRHTISVYDREFRLVRTIPDTVRLSDFGHPFQGEFQGSPVEAAAAPDGRSVYVSNYSMFGPGFREGADTCSPASGHPDSFVYRVDLRSLAVDQVLRVGAVPKFVAVTPDGRRLLVSNWCSYDVSVIDTATGRELERVPVGRYPRGLAVDPASRTAYVAVMGSTAVATIDLETFEVGRIEGVGRSPRHLVLSPDGRTLYVTLNGSGQLAAVDVEQRRVRAQVRTGAAPRSMTISDDGRALYVVNYESGTVAKVRASDLSVLQTVPVPHHPIGITYDAETRRLWVACYSGSLVVLQDGAPGA